MNFKKESYLVLLILMIYLKTFSYANEISESSSESESKENFSDLEIEASTPSTAGPEVSKSTMDIITVIWYLSTFLALAAFFFLMACSDRRCGRQRLPQEQNLPSNLICPPTPAPSYSEFAPPSYESVVKQPHIYVIPIDYKIETVNEKSNKTSQAVDYKIADQINDFQKNY